MSWSTDPAAPACTAAHPAPQLEQDAYRHPDATVYTELNGYLPDETPRRVRIRACPHCLCTEPAG